MQNLNGLPVHTPSRLIFLEYLKDHVDVTFKQLKNNEMTDSRNLDKVMKSSRISVQLGICENGGHLPDII